MWYNPIMMWILRSPLHGMLSGNTMIITYTGRKSGKTYSTPVNYVRDDDMLWTVSFRQRTWWRNLHDSPVTLRVQGKDVTGVATAMTDQQEVADCLMVYLRKAPQIAKYIGVGLDASGQPRLQDVAEAAKTRVMVRVQLSGSRKGRASGDVRANSRNRKGIAFVKKSGKTAVIWRHHF